MFIGWFFVVLSFVYDERWLSSFYKSSYQFLSLKTGIIMFYKFISIYILWIILAAETFTSCLTL